MPHSQRWRIGRRFQTPDTSADEAGEAYDKRFVTLLRFYGVEEAHEIAEQEAYIRYFHYWSEN